MSLKPADEPHRIALRMPNTNYINNILLSSVMRSKSKNVKYGWILDFTGGYVVIISFVFACLYLTVMIAVVSTDDVKEMILQGIVFLIVVCSFVAAVSFEQFIRRIRDLLLK